MPASALASARPDHGFVWAVRLACLGVMAAGIALLVAMIAAGGAGPVGLLIIVPLVVLGATWSRGNVVEVRVTAQGLDLVGVDGVVRSIPGEAIGGIGYAGAAIAGRLVAIPMRWLPNTMGRIVVVDRSGRVVCARRAGWMRLDELTALAATGGVAWLGSHARSVPGATVAPPPEMAHGHDGPACTDPRIVAAMANLRRRTRRVVLTTWALPLLATVCFVIMANTDTGALAPILGWVGGLAVGGFLLGGPCVALWSSGPRQVRRLLRTESPWFAVEAVVVSGLITDGDARVVGVVHPDDGEIAWWKVASGGERGWLQGDDRSWFWFAPAKRAKQALIAPPDRSHVAALEQRLLGKIALAEARAQVRSEAAEWQGREAWAAWAAAQPQQTSW